MTDKDVGPNLAAWWQQLQSRVPGGTRMVSFVALDLFAMVSTATVLSQARDATPRDAWNSVWFCRDGSFAEQLAYWRTASGEEVDFVIETEGRLLPIEIKASTRPGLSDAARLRSFRAEYGDMARPGLLLHTGTALEWLAPDVLAAPWWRVL